MHEKRVRDADYRAIAEGGASGAALTGAPTAAGGAIDDVAAGRVSDVAAVTGALPGNTTTRLPTLTRV